MAQQTQPAANPLVLFETDLQARRDDFRMLLPPSIRPEEFIRVALTAATNNLDLLMRCSKQSLFNALLKAAEDKLLPDGREGALVPYKGQAQWIPMREGVVKRIYETSGIILHCGVVYQGDEYDYERGDADIIRHRPRPGAKRSDPIVAAYVIAEFPDGRRIRDWMWREQIEEIRQRYARSERGPWSDPVAYPEMAVKTVIHHLSKDLPLSNELKRIVHRDDVLYSVGDDRPPVSGREPTTIDAPALQPQQHQATPAIEHRSGRTVESVLGDLGAQREPVRVNGKPAQDPAPSAGDGLDIPPSLDRRRAVQEDPSWNARDDSIARDADGSAYDAQTGEVIEEAAEQSQEARPEVQEKPGKPDGADIFTALKVLTDAAQPANGGEYEGFILARWQDADTEAKREAVRMYWQMSGGDRKRFRMSKNQEATIADQLRRMQAA